jgi:hypothetical protein
MISGRGRKAWVPAQPSRCIWGSAVRLGWRNGILWEPAVYECSVGVDSGVETFVRRQAANCRH